MKVKLLKTLALVMAAVLLVIATVFATMAYLTSSSAVSNVFTVGSVKIQMFETKVNNKGEAQEFGVKTADTNSYHLLPGKSYLKDPTVYVDKTCEPSYLFVRVRNDLKSIEEKNDPNHLTIVEQLKKNGWHEIERATSNVDAVFVYVGKPAVGEEPGDQVMHSVEINGETVSVPMAKKVGTGVEGEHYDVFNEFTITDNLAENNDQAGAGVPSLDAFGGARVAIVAYAIQADLADFDESQDCTYEAYMAAWEYIKNELPFVV